MTINHPEAILDALRERGIYCASQPFHLDTVWVHLADGSTLHIGDHEDNLELLGGHGYSVYRSTEGVPGLEGDEDSEPLASPDATFEQLLDAIAEQTTKYGQAEIVRFTDGTAVPAEVLDKPAPVGEVDNVVVDNDVEAEAVLTALNGRSVRVQIRSTDNGPQLALFGINCELEGDEPGRYLLVGA